MSKRILVVEDDPRNRKLVRDILAVKEYELHEAETGHEGVAKARALHPDLILMDIQLPGMDGLAATRALKADSQTADIPVLAVSALAMESDRVEALEAGCAAHLAKPFGLHKLLEAVAEMLNATSTADG